MDNNEAVELLGRELADFRQKSWAELRELISHEPLLREVRTYNDADYNIEVIASWADQPDGNIRVLAFIDDGELRSFIPISTHFIMTSDNRIIED